MRVAAHRLGRQADELEQPRDAIIAIAIGRDAMDLEWRAQDIADGQPRIERRERVLEDDLHPAPQRHHLLRGVVRDVLAGEPDLAGGGLDQLQDRLAHRRLAAAALADDAENFALAKLEIDAVDGLHLRDHARQDPRADREMRLQPARLEQRLSHRPPPSS